jgi:8-oxo-dGTP pyrophosphatase MutT (NUDIX family)
MKQKLLSAGAVPVRLKKDQWEFLILRAFNYWDFPKGIVAPGEDPWEGAIREVKEETGLSKFSTPWGKLYFETLPYGKGKVARYYLIKLEEDKTVALLPNPITGITEHHEYRWVKFQVAHNLVAPRIKAVIIWANKLINDSDPNYLIV